MCERERRSWSGCGRWRAAPAHHPLCQPPPLSLGRSLTRPAHALAVTPHPAPHPTPPPGPVPRQVNGWFAALSTRHDDATQRAAADAARAAHLASLLAAERAAAEARRPQDGVPGAGPTEQLAAEKEALAGQLRALQVRLWPAWKCANAHELAHIRAHRPPPL